MKGFWYPAGMLALLALAVPLAAWAKSVAIEGDDTGAAPPAVSETQVAPLVPVIPMTPSENQAEAAYDAAHKAYATGGTVSDGQGSNAGTPGVAGVIPPRSEGLLDGHVDTPEVVMLEDPSRRVIPGTKTPSNVALENIRLVLDVDNTTLKDVFAEVIRQAAQYTGTWTVKWRLKPEDMGLLDERVNLTAEAKFGDFVQLLTDRVRNMSGVQLFVTAFQESRVILVTDTAQ